MSKLEPQKVEVPVSVPITVPISVPIDVTTNTTSNDRLLYLREKLEKEHSLLNERSNIFLIWQSILIAGLAIGSTQTNFNTDIIRVLIVLGLISSIIWLYVGKMGKLGADFFWKKLEIEEAKLPEGERFYIDSFTTRRKRRIFKFAITDIFAYAVPSIWLIVWLFSLNYLWLFWF